MKNLKLKPIALLLSLMLLSQLSTAQYPKRIINGDTLVVMTQGQAININKTFNNLKSDSKRIKFRSDSISIMLNKERRNFSDSLKSAQNAYILSKEENKILKDTQESLRVGMFAQEISIVTFMFTVVMLIKITTGR